MSRVIIAFIISLLAGLSTCIGALFTWIKPRNINNFIGTTLAFSGTIMILISITELIPQGFYYLNSKYNALLAVLSLILMIILGIVINSVINKKISHKVEEKGDLYKVGILSMIVLLIHNLPEGILTFLSSTIDTKLGIKMAIAISLHNIPEGIAISVPIYYSTYSHRKSVVGSLISGFSEPFGALIAYLFLYKYITNTMISFILLFVAGLMISISINEIFDETKKYTKKSILFGVVAAFILIIISKVFF